MWSCWLWRSLLGAAGTGGDRGPGPTEGGPAVLKKHVGGGLSGPRPWEVKCVFPGRNFLLVFLLLLISVAFWCQMYHMSLGGASQDLFSVLLEASGLRHRALPVYKGVRQCV